jgi:hypothetical protein
MGRRDSSRGHSAGQGHESQGCNGRGAAKATRQEQGRKVSHRVALCAGMTPLCAAAAVLATQTAHRLCTQLSWLESKRQNCGRAARPSLELWPASRGT